VVSRGSFRYRDVNVAAQRDLDSSLMDTVQRLVRTRRSCPEVGWGECRVIDTDETGVLALRYDWRGESLLIVHNLADQEAEVKVGFEGAKRLKPLFSNRDDRTMRDAAKPIPLDPYGFRWFRADGERR
jgi:maltose alpha-D-glucosyltransferase/alpha-amylase